jgi:hypothetical protein
MSVSHSEFMRAANEQRLASFRRNSRFIKGVRWLGTLDGHCCVICAALDSSGWDLDGKPLGSTRFYFHTPPLHPDCRCVLSPIPKSELDEGPTIGGRASKDGPLAAGTTFQDFLKQQSPEFVRRMLGEARAHLFLSGKLGLRDFVTPDCRERTLAELYAMIGGKP